MKYRSSCNNFLSLQFTKKKTHSSSQAIWWLQFPLQHIWSISGLIHSLCRKAPKLSADPASLNDSPHSTSENFGEATPIRPTDPLGIIRDTFFLLLGINCFVQQMVRMIIMMVVLIVMKMMVMMMMVMAKLWCWCADERRWGVWAAPAQCHQLHLSPISYYYIIIYYYYNYYILYISCPCPMSPAPSITNCILVVVMIRLLYNHDYCC